MNRFSPTLSLYLGWQFLAALAAVLGILAGLILLFDMVELLRSSVSAEEAGMDTLLRMALLKLPHTVQDVMPFGVLLATMFALYRLARHSELMVMRSAGVSVWQFLAPLLALAVVIGAVNLTVINPFAAGMFDAFTRMKDAMVRRDTAALEVGDSGLWLREARDGGAAILHANGVRQDQGTLMLTSISIFEMDPKEKFLRRIEAGEGQLVNGVIKLTRVREYKPGEPPQPHDDYTIPTAMTLGQVQDSFSAPESMSFWDLPAFIAFSRESGFSALPYRLYWQSLLASPFMLCAMVLVAAAFYLTTKSRLESWTARGLAGLAAGFVLFFFSKLTYALGLSATLPLVLAAWAPTTVAALFGLAYLFHSEDG